MKPGLEITARERQLLRDLDQAPRHGHTRSPLRVTTLGYSLPVLDSLTDDAWLGLSTGKLAVINSEVTFDIRSVRFFTKVDMGTDGEVVRFDFGIYVVNPTDWRILTADDSPVASRLNAAAIISTREFTIARSNLADVAKRVEIYFERPVRLLGDQLYAILVAPRVAGEAIWCPSSGDTMFSLDSGNINEHIQIAAEAGAAPAIELRNELATRVYTGGATFTRF
jgi:hypothetical protein